VTIVAFLSKTSDSKFDILDAEGNKIGYARSKSSWLSRGGAIQCQVYARIGEQDYTGKSKPSGGRTILRPTKAPRRFPWLSPDRR
jgi:hypothetical protein